MSFALTHLSTHTSFASTVLSLTCGCPNILPRFFLVSLHSSKVTYSVSYFPCYIIERSFSLINSNASSTYPTLPIIVIAVSYRIQKPPTRIYCLSQMCKYHHSIYHRSLSTACYHYYKKIFMNCRNSFIPERLKLISFSPKSLE